MSKQRYQADDEDAGEEYESEQDDIVIEPERRRLRPRELMFSTTGRLALGAFGVLILLGGAAVVNQLIHRKTPVVAKKSNAAGKADAEKAKSAAPAAATGDDRDRPETAATPASAPESNGYAPVDPSDIPWSYESKDARPAGADGASPAAEVEADYSATGIDESFAEVAAEEPAGEVETDAETMPAVEERPPVAPSTPNPLRNTSQAAPIQPTREYVAREGETLFDIARYELHDAARWVEIYQLNASALGDQLAALPAGTRLRVPQR